jgi:hypothetical protein
MVDSGPSINTEDARVRACPQCGAQVDPDEYHLLCPACGSTLDKEVAALSDAERSGLIELATEANEKLVKAGADSAEQSFGLGCALGGMILLGAASFFYIFGYINIVLALIVLAMGSLALTGIAALVASFARNRSVGINFRSMVLPEIEVYLKKNNLTRIQFDRVAYSVLPSGAPLRACLPIKAVK